MVHVKRIMDHGADSISSPILGKLKAKIRIDIASGFWYDRSQVYIGFIANMSFHYECWAVRKNVSIIEPKGSN